MAQEDARSTFTAAVQVAREIKELSEEAVLQRQHTNEDTSLERPGKLWRPPEMFVSDITLYNEQSLALHDVAQAQTEANEFTAAIETATIISNTSLEVRTLLNIVQSLTQAGRLREAQDALTIALSVVQGITDMEERESALTTIAVSQAESHAEAGDFSAAFEAAHRISDAKGLASMLAKIGAVQARTDRESARATFSVAYETAQAIEDAAERSEALEAVVEAQAQAGEFSAAWETAKKILEAENQMEEVEDSYWIRALGRIAEQQAKSGYLPDALVTAQEIDYEEGQVEVLVNYVAESQADAGQTKDARVALTAALEIICDVEDEEAQRFWLTHIGMGQARIGEFTAAVKTLQKIKSGQQEAGLLGAIAAGQGRAGFNEQALQTMHKILIDRNKHLPAIAKVLVEAKNRELFKLLLVPCA